MSQKQLRKKEEENFKLTGLLGNKTSECEELKKSVNDLDEKYTLLKADNIKFKSRLRFLEDRERLYGLMYDYVGGKIKPQVMKDFIDEILADQSKEGEE